MSTTTLRKILNNRPLHSVAPNTLLRAVARHMSDHGVGAVAVVENGELRGILSERDLVFRGLASDMDIDTATAVDVMTPEPVTVDIDDPISNALAAHLGDQFRHLPVTESGKVVGLLSYRDIPPEYVMMFERFREMSSAHADDTV